ncbi:MAG TPA: beta-galactosidase [Plantibacter sp.]|uniref:beta-galactosidase n=1 Tax=unclassified Plantibacter TaxID=2624265 RepID=UPI002B741A89|nr:beta-galactosidase [Plantibacter sp.]
MDDAHHSPHARPAPAVRFGAAYYREYQPERSQERLDRDLDLMAAAGFTAIRVGESVWSTWEPRDGEFELEWMTPILEGAQSRGIGVILGTPTYAVPPWLQRKHPEIAARIAAPPGGERVVPWGGRQEIDLTAPAFRFHAERAIRKILARHGAHPAVIGVQLDNEPGLHLLHNAGVFAGFVDRLRGEYGDVEALNEAWGLSYWSHRLSDWDELWTPPGNSTPAYDLAWRRYQAELVAEFIGWQADIARELVPDDRFLTTCIAYNRPGVEDVALSRGLSITSGNAYYLQQDGLSAEADSRAEPGRWVSTSPAGLFQQADRMRASRQAPFLVTETDATSIAGSNLNLPGYRGQLTQAAFALIARGATLVSYWHWHTLHSGAETHWGGVLGHDLEPGRVYEEIAGIGRAITAAGERLRDLDPTTTIGFLFAADSRWALQFHPPLSRPGTEAPDPSSYDRVLARFYQAAIDEHLQVGFIHANQLDDDAAALVRRFPVLVAPALYALDDRTAGRLTAYAGAGGRLVLTFRSGHGDELGRARAEVAPGPLRAAAGIRITEVSNLPQPIGVTASELGGESAFVPPGDAQAEGWADRIESEGATPLLDYVHPHHGAGPAVTEHRVGDGSVTWIGTLPDRPLAAALLAHVAATAPTPSPCSLDGSGALPLQVTAHSAVNAAGEVIWFLHNWSWDAVELAVDRTLFDVLDARALPLRTGTTLTLGSWDVRVLSEGPAA